MAQAEVLVVRRGTGVMLRMLVLSLLPFVMAALSGCRALQDAPPVPTVAEEAQALAPTVTMSPSNMPATWTPPATAIASDTGPLPTVAPRPTLTPGVFPSNTPRPSPTVEASATPEATVSVTPTEIPTSPPPLTGNLLPNPSFEEGWDHIDGIPELQVPNRWQLAWEVGANPLPEDPAPWVRPESRVLPPDFLPADEHALFIWDGQQTVKIFKRQGAISFRLTTQIRLQPGTYMLEIHVFPDLIDEYEGDQKVWAPDPLSGEVRLLAGPWSGDWILPVFGQKNSFQHTFRVDTAQDVEVGAAMRGRWAILNNGWFMDDWRLVRTGN